MSRISGNFNFAANLEVLAKAPLDAKQKVGTYSDLTNPATWNQSGSVWLYDGAMVVVANDSDTSKNGIYWLCDAANYTNPSSWIKSGTGGGTITGATNGLFVTNSGTTIALGGNLTSGTTISGAGSHELNIQNIGGFNVSTPSDTTQLILEPAGITLSYSGTSVSLDSNAGLEYDGNYRSNFNEFSLPDVGYLTGITSTKLNISDFDTYTGVTAPSTYLKLDQSTPQNVIGSQPIFDEGITFGTSPSISQISGHTEGRIYYDSCYRTLSADIGDEVTVQLGQETFRYVYNSTGSIIPDGTPVYITGVHSGGVGEPDVVSVGLAIATGTTKSVVVGVTTQNIQINGYGYVTVRGAINNLNTLTTNPYSGMSTNDLIYLSPTVAGGVTNVAPTTPSVKILLGKLIRKSSTDGKIYVNINPIYSLNDLTDVTVPSPTIDDVLKWNGSEWVNATVGAVSAGAGVIFYNSTPKLFIPSSTPFGINSTGTGNGIQVASLSRVPVTTPTTGCTIIGNANNDTRFFSAWLYDQPLGRDVIDAGTWKSLTCIAVSTAAGTTCAGRNIFQVVPITGDTINITGAAANARTATLNSSTAQFNGIYFSASTVNTDASWLHICSGTSEGIYQICAKIDSNSVCIVVPSTFANSTGNYGNVWNKLFGAASASIDCVYPNYCTCEVSMTLPAFDVNCTDKLGQMGYVSSSGNRCVYMTYNGVLTASYFQTPLINLHNELAGLQGGTGTERYHINLEKYLVVQDTSGVNTGDETKETIETKLTGEIFSHYHPYSGLTGKPDLSIYHTISGFTGYTASTQPIIDGAITGITYTGDGNVVPYSGITDRNIVFNTIKGSGSTVVNKVGDNIIIYSSGGTGGEYVFDYDILVSIADGKTFGKYENGDTIPSSGKTAVDVIKMALSEPLEPIVNLGSSSYNLDFGESSKVVNLTFNHTILSQDATVQSACVQYCRVGGTWTTLTTSTTTPDTHTHNINDSGNRFCTASFKYRYIVNDTLGASGSTEYTPDYGVYVNPTFSPTYSGNTQSYESNAIREIGNVTTRIAGSVDSNNNLVYITGYTVYRCYNGGSYTPIITCTGLYSVSPITIEPYIDSGAAANSTSIGYCVKIGDQYTTRDGGTCTINLRYASYYGYCSGTTISGAQIVALGNQALCTSRARTMTLTAPSNDFTYVAYPESYGWLTNAIMDSASPVLGAFTCTCDNSVTNYYGQTVDYNLYKTIDKGAFTANSVAFT